jgi:hypothetical protein
MGTRKNVEEGKGREREVGRRGEVMGLNRGDVD